jgi:hypothetical protein
MLQSLHSTAGFVTGACLLDDEKLPAPLVRVLPVLSEVSCPVEMAVLPMRFQTDFMLSACAVFTLSVRQRYSRHGADISLLAPMLCHVISSCLLLVKSVCRLWRWSGLECHTVYVCVLVDCVDCGLLHRQSG